jgi:hypothetical protein
MTAIAATMLLAGCRQDMQNMPKMVPQRGSQFFADGRSVRQQVINTVARGQLHQDSYFYTGLMNGQEQNTMPFPVTMDVMRRGQERFNIYCTPCHSRVGNGAGMIVQRGYKPAGNYHDAKRLAQPLSHYFYVMSNGYGAMPDYSAQLNYEDRWAVAAYIRALQLSQNATPADVPAGVQPQQLEDIATSEGYAASYAGEWSLPATAVEARPRAPGAPGGVPAEAAPGQQPTRTAAQQQKSKAAPAGKAQMTPADKARHNPQGMN